MEISQQYVVISLVSALAASAATYLAMLRYKKRMCVPRGESLVEEMLTSNPEGMTSTQMAEAHKQKMVDELKSLQEQNKISINKQGAEWTWKIKNRKAQNEDIEKQFRKDA